MKENLLNVDYSRPLLFDLSEQLIPGVNKYHLYCWGLPACG